MRIHEVNVVHEHYVFKVIFNMFSPLMSTQLKNLIILHGTNYDKLHDTIDKSCIPTEFDGDWQVNNEMFTDELIDDINEKVKQYWAKYKVVSKQK